MVKLTQFDNEELLALAKDDLKNNNLENALLKLKSILESSDVSHEATQVGAQLYAQLGLFNKAEQLFRQCLENEPRHEGVQFQLGMTLYDQNKRDDALNIWLDVLKENELHPPALFYTGLVLAQNGEHTKAINYLQSIIVNINSENLYFSRAQELLQNLKNGVENSIAAESD